MLILVFLGVLRSSEQVIQTEAEFPWEEKNTTIILLAEDLRVGTYQTIT